MEHGAHLHRLAEPDVVHADAGGPLPPKYERVGEAQLVRLAHDEAAENLVESVPARRSVNIVHSAGTKSLINIHKLDFNLEGNSC